MRLSPGVPRAWHVVGNESTSLPTANRELSKKTRSMLTADEARAQKASKAAEKAAQAERNRAKSVAASEKADREKRMREKKEQVAAAKAAREAAKAAAKLPPSGKAEKELMKIVKRGDEAQGAGDFEAALEAFNEAMAGFVKLGAKRPKLAEKIEQIERWVEEEATC